MVELLKYEIVSPEEKVASGEAEPILVPGYEGDFTVLSNHAAYLSTLRPGILKIFSATENCHDGLLKYLKSVSCTDFFFIKKVSHFGSETMFIEFIKKSFVNKSLC